MASKKKLPLRQDAFDDHCLAHGDAMERLREQIETLYYINSLAVREDPQKLRAGVEDLDLDLVRYSLTSLRAHLVETAIRDGATLTAESVLDPSVSAKVLDRWERWLMLAPCWPALVKQHWYQIAGAAAEIVVSRLEEDGLPLDDETQKEIRQGVYALRLPDLLSPVLIERCFPREISEDEAEEGAEA